MSAESIQKSNWGWELRHLGKNASEWIQLQLSRGNEDREPATMEMPEWVGQLLLWIVIAGAVIWLAWLLVQFIEGYRARRVKPTQRSAAVPFIPPPPERTVADWVRQAHKFEQQGNWREACRALYLAALQLLHDRNWISHQFSRTDGEYLQAIQRLKQPRPWQVLLRTHERSHFGAEPLTADNLQHCRQAYQEIEKR
ncbi:MAG: DUF4129 domain-containing protein [Leptolyngbya sp. SIO1D8]|nr:DUF4129 domain-containing protein [Leptolyngbya sp. SIO1D8]